MKQSQLSDDARNELVVANYGLIRNVALKIWDRMPAGVDLDDLVSAGVLGCMQAVETFNAERGVKFSTYCAPRVRGAILDYLRDQDWLPRKTRAMAKRFDDVRERLAVAGEVATDDRLCSELGDTAFKDAAKARQVLSFDRGNEPGSVRRELLRDRRQESPSARLQRRELMREIMRGLSKTERMILILYYYEHATMNEIGKALQLSESRISQLHTEILQRLRGLLDRTEVMA